MPASNVRPLGMELVYPGLLPVLSTGISVAGAEYTEGTGIAVKERGTAYRPNFSVAEKSAQRNLTYFRMEDIRVMVGPSI